jgi:hypothetical protein
MGHASTTPGMATGDRRCARGDCEAPITDGVDTSRRTQMTTETPTIDQVLDLAHKLPREQRGQLIARLALELATAEPDRAPHPTTDGEALLAAVRERLAASPAERTLAEQLHQDRQDRDAALRGGA